jgi:high-affinity Fe2+/Pb2+ permease
VRFAPADADRSVFERADGCQHMVNESRTFGAVVALTLGGLAVMLYGVSLNAGQAMNNVMVAGGVVLLVALGLLTMGIDLLEADESDASH